MNEPNELHERCRYFCGDQPEPCFAERGRQVRCIADMVLNKVGGVQAALATARREPGEIDLEETLAMADESLRSLVEWVRYLHVAGDRNQLARLAAPRDARRREDRYPVPPKRRSLIHMEVATPEGRFPVTLEDFSRSGLQFSGKVMLKLRARYPAVIVLSTTPSHSLAFEVRIRRRLGGPNYTYGATLLRVDKADNLSVFVEVYEFLVGRGPADVEDSAA